MSSPPKHSASITHRHIVPSSCEPDPRTHCWRHYPDPGDSRCQGQEILTNRNQLSDDILTDVAEGAASYAISIRRAHVKDLVFPGNLQEIMNRVLAAERRSEAELVEARSRAETSRIEAQTEAERMEQAARAQASAVRIAAEADAEHHRLRAAAERDSLRERLETAEMFGSHPALVRLRELETLTELGRNARAQLILGVDQVLGGLDADGGHDS